MKVKVNVNARGVTTDSLIENKLKDAGLPTCFGQLILPAVKNIISCEIANLFVARDTAHPDNIASDKIGDLYKLVIDQYDTAFLNKHVLSVDGENFIQKFKEEQASMYVDQIIKCVSCEHKDLCSKLTENYIRSLVLKQSITQN